MPKDIKNNVMRRVYILHTLRRIFSPTMFKIYIAIAFIWQIIVRVSVGDVLSNSMEAGNQYSFWSSAFTTTETSVLLLTIAFALIAIWLARDLVASINSRKLTFQVEQGER